MDKPVIRQPSSADAERKITIIFNPVAGNRRRGLLDDVIAELNRLGWKVSVNGTTGPGSATNLATQAIMLREDVIVAAGGDGTINEVVSGMQGAKTPLGVIPMGTANVLAVEMKFPRRADAIAASITAGNLRRLHLPTVNNATFLLMVGVGFDGAVVSAVTNPMKRRWGKLAFVMQGLRKLAGGPATAMKVTVDGSVFPAEWVIVTNISHYGGAYRLTPDVDPGQASLTAVIFTRAGRLHMTGHFLRLQFGRVHHSRHVVLAPAVRVEIAHADGARPAAVQIDGDAAGTAPCSIAISDQFVDILAPMQADDAVDHVNVNCPRRPLSHM